MNSTFNPDMSWGEPTSDDALQLEEYRRLTREHLENLPALFTKLTGLESSVTWAPTWPHRWGEKDLPTGSRVCRNITAGTPAAMARCRNCGMRHLALTLRALEEGHHFHCDYGVLNFWFPIIVRRCAVGIGFVQALDGVVDRGAAGPESERAGGPAASRPGRVPGRQRGAAERMTPAEFKQVARLLQLIFQHAQTSALSDLRQRDLTRAEQALLELQSVATRLRGELRRVVPALHATSTALQPEAHSHRIARAALEYIRRNYSQPITLQRCAVSLAMNASYLSTLFARAVGLPFKTYLTEVRMEKARQLLGNPARNISDIAAAVGYASENRFRSAFKKLHGLSPKLWRETFHAVKLVLLGSLAGELEIIETVGSCFF